MVDFSDDTRPQLSEDEFEIFGATVSDHDFMPTRFEIITENLEETSGGQYAALYWDTLDDLVTKETPYENRDDFEQAFDDFVRLRSEVIDDRPQNDTSPPSAAIQQQQAEADERIQEFGRRIERMQLQRDAMESDAHKIVEKAQGIKWEDTELSSDDYGITEESPDYDHYFLHPELGYGGQEREQIPVELELRELDPDTQKLIDEAKDYVESINGAATYQVEKTPDQPINDVDLGAAMNDGSPVVTSTFNDNTNVVGILVDSKVDHDAAPTNVAEADLTIETNNNVDLATNSM